MNITTPEVQRDKVELSAEDINAAVDMWLWANYKRSLFGELNVTTTVGNGFRAVGELKLPSEMGLIKV